jgi:hypothetical protein
MRRATLDSEQSAMRKRWAEVDRQKARVRDIAEKWRLTESLFTWDLPTHARFMIKVDDESPGDCWLWLANLDRDGYGKFSLHGVQRAAHRVAYEAVNGPVPAGLTLDHLCRVRRCVNPLHLEAVPHKVNVNRGLRKLKPEEIVQKSSRAFLKPTPITLTTGAEGGT